MLARENDYRFIRTTYKISIYKMRFGRLIIDRYGVWVRRPHGRPRLQIKFNAPSPVSRDYGSSGANSEIKA